MYALGIETSCDETSVSVLENEWTVLSNIVSSSLNLHKRYGGVIPEIASRSHLETIGYTLNEALKESEVKLKDIGLISVTSGPGLSGSLLVGICFAKAIAFALGLPLVGINHLYAHLYAAFLNTRKIPKTIFPFVGLVVSGGHTSLFYVKDFTDIESLGFTLDDACGEAFDKVAKILGLGYPGGPLIERLSKKGDSQKNRFSRIRTKNPLDFSFSGIKTAILYMVKSKCGAAGKKQLTLNEKRDIAASFQELVFDTLIEKSFLACRMKRVERLVIGGGVAANNRLREKFIQEARSQNIKVYFSPKEFCTDNAAMVGGLGYFFFKKGKLSSLRLNAQIN